MGKRVAVSLEAAFVLFLIPAGLALFLLRRAPELNFAIISLVLFVPACASILLVALTSSFRSLLFEPRITFPVTVTFPLIHAGLMLAIVKVAATTPQALEVLPPRMAPAVIWDRWGILAGCSILDFIVLNVLRALAGRA